MNININFSKAFIFSLVIMNLLASTNYSIAAQNNLQPSKKHKALKITYNTCKVIAGILNIIIAQQLIQENIIENNSSLGFCEAIGDNLAETFTYVLLGSTGVGIIINGGTELNHLLKNTPPNS